MDKLVSVILATYNSEDFIRDTIESILQQTYYNLELIIVDDASSDHTVEIIQSYADDRIVLITLDKNHHVCNACNTASDYINGDYVAYIGHDDIWEKDKLEKQITFLENNMQYGICFSWAKIINEENIIINEIEKDLYHLFKQSNKSKKEWILDLMIGNCLCGPSAVLRKSLYSDLGGYNIALLQLQDFDLWLRALIKTSIYVLPEELVRYRRFQNREMLSSRLDNRKVTRSFNEQQYIIDDFLDLISNSFFIDCFEDYFINKNAKSEEEVEIEKAFLLLKYNNVAYMRRFIKLLQNKETRLILKKSYSFDEINFYEISQRPLYWNEAVYQNMEQQKLLIQEFEQIFSNVQQAITSLKNDILEKEKYIHVLEDTLKQCEEK